MDCEQIICLRLSCIGTGNTEAWAVSQKRTANYSKEDWARYHEAHNAICRSFSDLRAAGIPTDDQRAFEQAVAYASLVDQWFYPCEAAQLAGLALCMRAMLAFGKPLMPLEKVQPITSFVLSKPSRQADNR